MNTLVPDKRYAGIGSRNTPSDILALMSSLASSLEGEGWVVRSGGAAGADLAFSTAVGVAKEVYLPWHHYNNLVPGEDGVAMTRPSPAAVEQAANYHPAWDKCRDSVRLLHGRNLHIILGPELDDPVKFVVCWTPGGRKTGGTALGISVAEQHGIPVFNLALREARDRVARFINGQGVLPRLAQ